MFKPPELEYRCNLTIDHEFVPFDELSIYCTKCGLTMRDECDEEIEIREAAESLYDAGHWTCDRKVDEAALWIKLRDALGREPGGAPIPITKKPTT